MDAEEQANLATFLAKVSGACKNDSDVPDFIGAQVNEWLAEIATEPKQVAGDSGAAASSEAAPVEEAEESAASNQVVGSTGEAP